MSKYQEEVVNVPPVAISNEKIQKFLSSKFVEWDGCILLQAVNDTSGLGTKFIPNKYYQDRTEYEAFCNHIHVNDLFPELEDFPQQSLKLALRIMEVWEGKLKNDFPSMSFHIVLSHDEFGSVLRFYKYRQEEGSWLNTDNINNYTEGILLKVIE